MKDTKQTIRRRDGVHAGGRPALSSRPAGYYYSLLADYEKMTLSQLADRYGVSKTTICKHLNYAREMAMNDESKQPE